MVAGWIRRMPHEADHVLDWPCSRRTISAPEHIFLSARIRQSHDRWSGMTRAGSSRPPWSAASIIVTRARRRKIRPAGGLYRPHGSRRSAGPRGSPRCSSPRHLKRHTKHVGPGGLFLQSQGPVLLERPQPVLRTLRYVKRKGQGPASPRSLPWPPWRPASRGEGQRRPRKRRLTPRHPAPARPARPSPLGPS
jgi:hypothetical protein